MAYANDQIYGGGLGHGVSVWPLGGLETETKASRAGSLRLCDLHTKVWGSDPQWRHLVLSRALVTHVPLLTRGCREERGLPTPAPWGRGLVAQGRCPKHLAPVLTFTCVLSL